MIKRVLMMAIRGYQRLFSAVLPNSCRFQPTCSVYAHEAIETRGALRGVILTARRLSRCNPWGGSGYDPVPPHAHKTSSKGGTEESC